MFMANWLSHYDQNSVKKKKNDFKFAVFLHEHHKEALTI